MKRLVEREMAMGAVGGVQRWPRIVAAALAAAGHVTLAASVAWAGGGGHHVPGPSDLHINWWTWDTHAPPMGWFIINFLVFVFGLVKLTKKGLAKSFQDRHDAIRKSLLEAQALHDAAQARRADLKAKIDALDAEAAKVVAEARAEGALEAARLVDAAKAAAGRVAKDSASVVAYEQAKSEDRLRRQAARDALDAAEGLLSRELSDSDRSRLLDDAIEAFSGAQALRGAA